MSVLQRIETFYELMHLLPSSALVLYYYQATHERGTI